MSLTLSNPRVVYMVLAFVALLGVGFYLKSFFSGAETYQKAGLLRDAVELSDEYKRVVDEVDHEARKEVLAMKNVHPKARYVHFWEAKKRILKAKYGINWHTPKELNPDAVFN